MSPLHKHPVITLPYYTLHKSTATTRSLQQHGSGLELGWRGEKLWWGGQRPECKLRSTGNGCSPWQRGPDLSNPPLFISPWHSAHSVTRTCWSTVPPPLPPGSSTTRYKYSEKLLNFCLSLFLHHLSQLTNITPYVSNLLSITEKINMQSTKPASESELTWTCDPAPVKIHPHRGKQTWSTYLNHPSNYHHQNRKCWPHVRAR